VEVKACVGSKNSEKSNPYRQLSIIEIISAHTMGFFIYMHFPMRFINNT